MTPQEILEYNKRCAEFLEYEFDELSETYETPHLKLVEPQAFGDEQFSCKLKIYELDFHLDWNWIMEVVEAIEMIENDWPISTDEVLALQLRSSKEAVIQAINQFLIWYNETLQTNQ